MKYVKTLGLRDENYLGDVAGFYKEETDTIWVNYSNGVWMAFVVGVHEFLHKVIAKVGIRQVDFDEVLDNFVWLNEFFGGDRRKASAWLGMIRAGCLMVRWEKNC